MIATFPKATPKSADGGMLLDGLLVNELGHTEPVFMLRASEPAMLEAMNSLLHIFRAHSYDAPFMEQVEDYMREMNEWQAQGGQVGYRRTDKYIFESKQLPKQDNKKAGAKK